MTDTQKLRFLEPLPQREETPLVKRLDGEVTSIGDIAFAGGMYCEVWVGRWEKGGREGIGEEKVDVEKVSLSLTTPILLIWLVIGGLESTSNTQVTGTGA